MPGWPGSGEGEGSNHHPIAFHSLIIPSVQAPAAHSVYRALARQEAQRVNPGGSSGSNSAPPSSPQRNGLTVASKDLSVSTGLGLSRLCIWKNKVVEGQGVCSEHRKPKSKKGRDLPKATVGQGPMT